ncbi:hypothetical protein KIN20_001259 [Parelaphostrongylus tenuis]|uniref:Uncharacterized protein n=1 Tax=Parelaphostrongylus tenuis TaxID=148309 RepID=A0AAD5MLX5_PARTN|nr:hypothetical protein KIN20_001259 [Parelaphostrongylus tenuis]
MDDFDRHDNFHDSSFCSFHLIRGFRTKSRVRGTVECVCCRPSPCDRIGSGVIAKCRIGNSSKLRPQTSINSTLIPSP